MNIRQIAIVTGGSLVLMAVVAAFTMGYALAEFNLADQAEAVKEAVLARQGLYKGMLAGILVILLLDLLVSYSLYAYFKADSRRFSLISAALRIIYTLVFGAATFFLVKNLDASNLDGSELLANIQSFQSTWSGGLIIFGFHLLLVAVLMKLHSRIPKILWYLAFIAGASYVLVNLLKMVSPGAEYVRTLEMILTLPMAIGELGLAVWLLVRGGKEKKLAGESGS